MVLRLLLVCHGPTTATRTASFPADDPLDAAGLAKTRAVSHRFSTAAAFVRSPALAAGQTAQALHLQCRVEPALREGDYGSWAGRSLEAVQGADPEGTALWLTDPSSNPHGGESLLAMLDRVSAWLAALGDPSGEIVALTHASVARAAIIVALDAPPHAFWRVDVSPLSLTLLRRSAGRWTLASANQRLGRRQEP